MKIAQLVLPWIPIPPPGYAGTERVVYELTEGLVNRGHEVTLFSVGESRTSAKLSYIFERAMGLQNDVMGSLKSSFYPMLHVADCFARGDEFDIIHSHAQFLGLPFAAVCKTPSVHTFHRIWEFEGEDEKMLVDRYKHLNFTSISDAQRVPDVNFVSTVYNGVDTNQYVPADNPSRDYLFWAGRVIEKKGPKEAIEVAKRTGMKLIMAGAITENEYFQSQIKPLIEANNVDFRGELSEGEMIGLFQNAKITLVPVKWNEPFGLIPVESLSCATPVVGFALGGLAETIKSGTVGHLVGEEEGIDKLAEKTTEILHMSSQDYQNMCQAAREHATQNFSIERMVEGYEKVYNMIVDC